MRPLQTQPPPAPQRQQRRVPPSPCTKRAIFVRSVHGYKPARARRPGSAAPAAPPHTAPAPVPPCRAAAGTQVRGPWPRAVRPRRRSAQPRRRKQPQQSQHPAVRVPARIAVMRAAILIIAVQILFKVVEIGALLFFSRSRSAIRGSPSDRNYPATPWPPR